MGFILNISLVIMGISSITAQVLLMRELLVSFNGNELTFGVILANWLLLEAFGSFVIGRTVERIGKQLEGFVLFQLIFSLTVPLSIHLSRIFKNLLLSAPGEGLGLAPIFCASFLILLPVALPHGALFTYGCKIYSSSFKKGALAMGNVYVLETVGIMSGGLFLTFFLIQSLHSFEIAFLLSLLNALISLLLLWPLRGTFVSALRRGLSGLSFLFALLFAFLLLSSNASRIHRSSIYFQWKDMGIVHYENSIYGNITVTQRGEQYSFFSNGTPTLTTPVPNIASIEDFVHFPMLFHQKPETILILSGGAGGTIHEILKYPVTRIDYVELDPLLLKLIKRFSTPLTESEISNPETVIHHTDGRFFINKALKSYDIIFLGLSAPQDLQANRFFSLEFFAKVRHRLNPDGILVLTLPGSLTYLSRELKGLNGCILDTLKKVFPFVKIIPGDTNLYLASSSDKLGQVTVSEMVQRLEARGIRTKLITQGYLEDRLHDRWQAWLSQSMEGRTPRINSDFHPLGVFFSLSHWNALFSPYLSWIFEGFERFGFKLTLAILTLFSFLMVILFIKKPSASVLSIPYAIFNTGLSGMVFSLAILFAFQTLYGYLYEQIGLLVALFMAGIGLGSILMTRRLDRIKDAPSLFLGIELAIILFSLCLPFAFSLLAKSLQAPSTGGMPKVLFWILPFLLGFIMGLQFPLSTSIYLGASANRTLGWTAGLMYAADLLGGFFGGLLGGVFFLPILGLKETCFMMAMLKLSSFILCFLFTRICRPTHPL
jgi:spermidine synthase